MNIKQLRFVYSLAQVESFTVAADKCCVTQPTLSSSVAQLEGELGEKLFKRSTRKVELTAFGKCLMPYIKNVLDAESALVQQAEVYLKPNKQLIRIGTSPLIDTHKMGLILEPFRQKNPKIDIVLREINMDDLHKMLDHNQIDFGFGPSGVYTGSWERAELYEEPLMYIPKSGGASKQREDKNSVTFKDIADEVYVMVPDACGLSRATRSLFRAHRKKLQEYTGKAMSYQVLSEWASLGIGAAILPQAKLRDENQAAFLIKDKANNNVKIVFEAIWHAQEIKTDHLQIFCSHLKIIAPKIMAGLGDNTI